MINFFDKLHNMLINIKNKIINLFSSLYSKHPLILFSILVGIVAYYIYRNDIYIASIYLSLIILLSSLYIFFKNELKKRSSADLDNYERIVRSAGMLSVVFLAITYFILNFARFIIPDVLHFGSVDSWIQFAGSILGGTLTLFALAITLNEQDKKRDLEKKEREKSEDIEHIPLLKITPLGFKETPEGRIKNIQFYDSSNLDLIIFTQTFTVSNILFNERPRLTQVAKNIRIESAKCYLNKPFFEKYIKNNGIIFKEDIEITVNNSISGDIYPGYEDQFEIQFILNRSCINDSDEWLDQQFINTKLKLFYSGHHETFETCIEFTFSFRVEEIQDVIKNDFPKYKIIQDSVNNRILPKI